MDRRAREDDSGDAPLVKVSFELDPDSWHRTTAESMWARPVGRDRFVLLNSPFYAHGVSYRDVVAARIDKDGRLVYTSTVQPGGHSTYRIIPKVARATRAFRAAWTPLADTGCSWEEGPGDLLTVDVPPAADIHRVYEQLEAGEKNEVWDFEEGHCGHDASGAPR